MPLGPCVNITDCRAYDAGFHSEWIVDIIVFLFKSYNYIGHVEWDYIDDFAVCWLEIILRENALK